MNRQSPAAIAAAAVAILVVSLVTAIASNRSGDDVAIDQVDVTPAASESTSDAASPPSPASTPPTDAPSEATTATPGEDTPTPSAAPTENGEATPSTAPPPEPTPEPTSEAPAEPTPDPTPTQTATDTGYSPVPADTYRYDTDGWSQFNDGDREDLPEVTTLTARAASDGRQIQIRDMRHDDGSGQVSTYDFSFADDAVRLHSIENETTVNFFGQITETQRFTADPPAVVATPGMGEGDVMTFRLQGDGTTADVTITVLREDSVTVGGQATDAIVVEQVTRLSGEVEGTTRTIAWYRPDDLLTLREEVTTDVTAQGQRIRSEYTAVLTP